MGVETGGCPHTAIREDASMNLAAIEDMNRKFPHAESEGQCAHCGATKRFAEAHLYMQSPGVVARCAVCEHVLLRFVKARQRAFLDLREMTCLILDTSQLQEC
jgi:hypothetical protein